MQVAGLDIIAIDDAQITNSRPREQRCQCRTGGPAAHESDARSGQAASALRRRWAEREFGGNTAHRNPTTAPAPWKASLFIIGTPHPPRRLGEGGSPQFEHGGRKCMGNQDLASLVVRGPQVGRYSEGRSLREPITPSRYKLASLIALGTLVASLAWSQNAVPAGTRSQDAEIFADGRRQWFWSAGQVPGRDRSRYRVPWDHRKSGDAAQSAGATGG